MSLKFRQAFKDTLVRCCGKQRNNNRFGKFVGSTNSFSQVRFNSTLRSTISRNEFSLTPEVRNKHNFTSIKEEKICFCSPISKTSPQTGHSSIAEINRSENTIADNSSGNHVMLLSDANNSEIAQLLLDESIRSAE
jgi:hypothetical protein